MDGYIKGKYRKSIYHSEEGYHIGIFKVIDTNISDLEVYINRTITFTGYFHELNDIDTYLFYGNLVNHEKYGEQFQTTSYERCIPDEKDSIVEFLTSGLFKGIGKSKAEKIFSVLGKDTLNVILENPSNLILIPTITQANANMLHSKMLEYQESYDTILYLSDLGFTTKDSMKIYNHYQNRTKEVVENNIYDLINNIVDMTFKKIDTIFLKNNSDLLNINRVKAAVIYILTELTNSYGHSYFYKNEISYIMPKVLHENIDEELMDKALDELILDLEIKLVEDKYYLIDMYDSECLIVNRFNILNNEKKSVIKNIDKELERLEEYFSLKYNKNQETAIKEALRNKFLIITGGPGTGKTTIMHGICEAYKNIHKYNYDTLTKKIALLSPTGRAAKRITETTHLKASTIHRFLKWNKDTDKFSVNEYNKSDVEFVIIDEASMIDTYLMANLLKGLSVNTKIILIGDYDQLPSVGPGQVLYDLISSDKLKVCRLEELYRQAEDSNILKLAYDIKEGKINDSIFNIEEDLSFIKCPNNMVISSINDLSGTYKDLSYKDFQVLVPMYKTINGIDNINKNLQNIFNKKRKDKKEIIIGEVTFREHDKVIQLSNMPDDNVFNGDIGIIEKITKSPKKEIYIDFDGNLVKYTPTNFNNFRLAYAISIHKAQGSETDVVILPLVQGYKRMLYKKLIYTAVTRAKKKLYLVGDMKALEYAIKNDGDNLRRTTIKELLISGIK